MHPDRMVGFYVLLLMQMGLVLVPLVLIARTGIVLDDIMTLQVILLLETLAGIIFTSGMMEVSRSERGAAACWKYLLTGD